MTECVIAHNAHPGRRTEIAAGRSFDDAWAGAMAGAVVRRISDAQARVLMLSAERVKIARNGEFHLQAGRVAHRPPNRYHDPMLVNRAGEMLVARFDPNNLHGPCLVYDREGRWVCEATCLLPAGIGDTGAAGHVNRARRQIERATRRALEGRRDMAALLDDLAAAGPPQPPPAAEPAAVRLVTGPHLPEIPRQDGERPDAGGPGIDAGAEPLALSRPTPRRRSAFMAALKTVQQMEEDEQ